MIHTEQLSQELSGFQLYILPKYDDFIDEGLTSPESYTFAYSDDMHSFMQWYDGLSHEELLDLIEEYAQEVAQLEYA